jgi:HEAT repeat protein
VSNPIRTSTDYHKHVNALSSTDWKKRDEELKILREGGRATLSAMKQAFTHGDWRVRRECAAYMDHFADNTCVAVLLRALKDPNQKVRRNAIHSLSCDRCKPAPLISDVIPQIMDVVENDRSPRVRRSALGLLIGRMPEPRVAALLHKIAASEPDRKMQRHAERALARHGQQV